MPAEPQASALPDRQVIQGYGDGRFRISGAGHSGPVIVTIQKVLPWTMTDLSALTLESLAPAREAGIDILLLGCGASAALVPSALKQALRKEGISLDAMGTGAACRTFNVLSAEARRVAAALLPIA
jgi:uncharacterized protein